MTDKAQRDAKAFSDWFAKNHLRFLKLTGQAIRDIWLASTSPADAEQKCEAAIAALSRPKRVVYANIFPDGVAYWFNTEAEARAGLNARALKIAVPVTYEA